MNSTQETYPRRATIRTSAVVIVSTVLVILFALSFALESAGYTAGIAGSIIALSTLIQRMLLYPPIAQWINSHVPWLAPQPKGTSE